MATAKLTFTIPPEDVASDDHADVFDNGVLVGTADISDPNAASFVSADLPPGDHLFTVLLRSKAGAEFDSGPSNTAVVTVPEPAVKLTAVTDLAAVLQV